ncbi:hypothetical protein WJX74_006520 [Apatococcus lobatus]|uniref:Cilia- and flagella-associated protein 91 n=1 Tax=Apatococcus lobatus TaxID=904363 RepID=A0AAW1RBI4_9CHLO
MPAERAYDAFYDGTYTLSSFHDYARAQAKGAGGTVAPVPVYQNFFSSLQHYPAQGFKFEANGALPAYIRTADIAAQSRQPSKANRSGPAAVSGVNRIRHAGRPLYHGSEPLPAAVTNAISQLQQPSPLEQGPSGPITVPHYPQGMEVAPESELNQDTSFGPQISAGWPAQAGFETTTQSGDFPGGFTGESRGPVTRAVGTQSDYRESETQTGPWEPTCKTPATPTSKQTGKSAAVAASGPEIALLRGMDLPIDSLPSQADVDKIHNMRLRRAFEASLPQMEGAGPRQAALRERMLSEWEEAEWDERDEEVETDQKLALAQLEKALMLREQHIEAGHAVRVAAIQSKRSQSQQSRFSRLHRQRVGASRRLSSLRRAFRSKPPAGEPPLAPTVDAYAEYTSNVYAPLQRLGRFPETCRPIGHPDVRQYEFPEPNPAGLEAALPRSALQPRDPSICKQPPKPRLKSDAHRDAIRRGELEFISGLLTASKEEFGVRGCGHCWPAPLADPVSRPPRSPLVSAPSRFDLPLSRAQSGTESAQRTPHSPRSPRKSIMTIEEPSIPEIAAMQQHGDIDQAATILQKVLRGRAVQQAAHAAMRSQAATLKLLLGTETLPSFDTTPPPTASSRPIPSTLVGTGTDPHRPLPQGMAAELGWGSLSRPRSALPARLHRRESRGEHRLQGQLTPISGVVAGLVDAALADGTGDVTNTSMRRPGTAGTLSDAAGAQAAGPEVDPASDASPVSNSMRHATPGSSSDATRAQPSQPVIDATSNTIAVDRLDSWRPATPGSMSSATISRRSGLRDDDTSDYIAKRSAAGNLLHLDVPFATMVRPAGTPVSNVVAGLVNEASEAASMSLTSPGSLSAAPEATQRMTPISHVVVSLVEDAIFDEGPAGSDMSTSRPSSLSPSPRGTTQYSLERPRTAGGLPAAASFGQIKQPEDSISPGIQTMEDSSAAGSAEPDAILSEALTLEHQEQHAATGALTHFDQSAKQPSSQSADLMGQQPAEALGAGGINEPSIPAREKVVPDELHPADVPNLRSGFAETDNIA